jgi:hypothetical protein
MGRGWSQQRAEAPDREPAPGPGRDREPSQGNAAFQEDHGLGSGGGDDDLDAALADLDAALARLPRGVPTYEAVTSSTGAETSHTDQVREYIPARWNHETLDYTDAARAIADQERTDGSHPTRSAQLGSGVAYDLRWGLHISCLRYSRPGGDLTHMDDVVGQVAARGASGDFDRSSTVQDPPAATLLGVIHQNVAQLSEALNGGRGQLTVSIFSHGGTGPGGGYVRGADTEMVTYAELETLARDARRSNVHVVYVIDSCLSGDLTVRANEAAAQEVELDALMTEASGGDATEARDRLALARQLMGPLRRVNENGGRLRSQSRGVRHGGRDAYATFARTASSIGPDLDELEELLDTLAFPADEADAVDALGPRLHQARIGLLISLPGDVATVSRGMHDLAGFLDPMNGLVNRLLEGADRSLEASQAR